MKKNNFESTTPLLAEEEGNISEEDSLTSNKIDGTRKHRDDDDHKNKNLRRTIIYVMYFTVFLQAVSYAFTFGSLWQYLKTMNEDITEVFLGWMITCRSFVALIACFVFGYWCDKRPWIEPLFLTIVLFFVGNILYAVAESFGRTGIWIVFISQLSSGLYGGVVAISRTLIAHYSYSEEISKAFSYFGLFQTIGIMIGPSIQIIGLLFAGNSTSYANFHIDLYTAPCYFMMALGLINVGLYLWLFYKDLGKRKLEPSEIDKSLPELKSGISVDKFVVASMLLIFFIVMTQLVINEVIFSPVLMEVIGWGKETSVKYGSFMVIGHTILLIIIFLFISPLSKRINDKLLLLFGLISYLVVALLHFPFGPGKLELRLPDVRYPNGTIIHSQDGGCPYEYEWCHNTPRLPVPQLLVASMAQAIPSAVCTSLVNIIYAKIIGPYHQGVYMGLLEGVCALSRAVSPFYISYVYKYLGVRAEIYVSVGLTLVAIISFLIIWNRVVPINTPDK